jgi:hypothetical protein
VVAHVLDGRFELRVVILKQGGARQVNFDVGLDSAAFDDDPLRRAEAW